MLKGSRSQHLCAKRSVLALSVLKGSVCQKEASTRRIQSSLVTLNLRLEILGSWSQEKG